MSKNLFENALAAEGVTGRLADLARSIYAQESGGGRNTKTSNAGAVGGMQIIPSTFNQMADQGWDISNPEHNARAGIRYIREMDKLAGGDPVLAAAGYYGGPGGLRKAREGIAVSDPRNPKAPTTLQYGQQVAARMGQPDPAIATPVPDTVVAERPLDAGGVPPAPAEVMMGYVSPYQSAPSASKKAAPTIDPAMETQQALANFANGGPQSSIDMKALGALMNNHITPNIKAFSKWGTKV